MGVGDEAPLPTKLEKETNLVWRTALPLGKSSPVFAGERIFLTGHEGETLYTFAIARETGKVLWKKAAPTRRLEKMHNLNDEASASPATDGENVYVFFGGYGMLSYDRDGEERWRRPMGPFTNFHGMGASPIYADGKILMVCDQDQDAFVTALSAEDGTTAWVAERPEFVHSFSSPVIYRPAEGPAELIVPGSYQMASYEIATGKKLWWVLGLSYQVKSTPVIDGDTLYFSGWAVGGEPDRRLELPEFPEMIRENDADGNGKLSKAEIREDWHPSNWDMQDLNKDGEFDARDWRYYQSRRTSSNSMMAIRLGGRGNVTDSHVLWRYQRAIPEVPSVLIYDGLLYGVKSGGIVTAMDPEAGEPVKVGRLREALESYYASPVGGDGKVFFASEVGKISVIKAGRDWEVIAVSDLGEPIYATPAIVDGNIYVRTSTALYRFSTEGQR